MPEQFWQLTFGEFMELVEGQKSRDQEQWRKVAMLAIWTSQKLKKGTTVDKLLNPKKKEKVRTNPAATRAYLDELAREFGG